MCGYVGLVNKGRILGTDFRQILPDILKHRGPDNTSFYNENNLYLFHNRLSIIDPGPEANQPMTDKLTGNTVVFNGEIYNYIELKNKYKEIQWTTSSDTEVLLKLYARLGEDCVKEFNGIFSFVIYQKYSCNHNNI